MKLRGKTGMKSKLIYLSGIPALILFSILFSQIDQGSDKVRYMQHEEPLPETPAPKADFVSHLPVISIDTKGNGIPWYSQEGSLYDADGTVIYGKSDEEIETMTHVSCHVSVSSKEGSWHTLHDVPTLSCTAIIRVRGNSSRHFDKKSYLLRLTDKNGVDEAHQVMGMSRASEWVLNGPILDRTLLRNYLCYNVAGQVMDYAPNVRYCELFLDGEYRGIYLAAEAITKEKGRIHLAKPENGKASTDWLIRIDREGKGDIPIDSFSHYTYQLGVSAADLRYPGKNLITPERLTYVTEDLSEIERSIYSTDRSDPVLGYSAYLDTEAFAQYFVLNEFFRNVDAGRFSTYYYKNIRGKVTPVVWDFNNCSDNYIDYIYDEKGFTMTQSPWFGQLMKDPAFVAEVIDQYRNLRQTVLSDGYINQLIDDTTVYLGDAIDRNYEVFGYVFDLAQTDSHNYLFPLERNYTSYEEAVTQLKEWQKARGAWLDDYIDTLQQYCQDSKNAAQIIE